MKLFLILGYCEDRRNPWKILSTGTPFRLSSFLSVCILKVLFIFVFTSIRRGSSFQLEKLYLREGSGTISGRWMSFTIPFFFHRICEKSIKFFILMRVYCKERTRGSRKCCSSLLLNILFRQRLTRWCFVVDPSKSACHSVYDQDISIFCKTLSLPSPFTEANLRFPLSC